MSPIDLLRRAQAEDRRGYRFITLGNDAGLTAGVAQRMVQAIRA